MLRQRLPRLLDDASFRCCQAAFADDFAAADHFCHDDAIDIYGHTLIC